MSYILNALRKSEQERQAMQPETVTDRILAQQPERRRGIGKWIAVVLLGNVLVIAAIIWYIQAMPRPTSVLQASKKSPVDKTEMKKADKPLSDTIESPKPMANLSPPPTSPLLAASNPQKNQVNSPARLTPPLAPASAPVPEPSFGTGKPSITKKEPLVIPAKQSAPKTPVTAPAEEKKPEPAAKTDNKIPFLGELPDDFRQSVPKMTINVFVFSSDPAERFVVINMAKYKTGQLTSDQVEIKEILPESLIVSYRNQIFRIGRP
jgi:general secretion pathway protein B